MRKFVRASMLLAMAVGSISPTALAQANLSLRHDSRSGNALPRARTHGHGLTESAVAQPSWSFSYELDGAYTTNAGSTPDNEQSSYYLTPDVTLGFDYPNLLDWTLDATIDVSADYYASGDSAFDDAVPEFDLELTHDFGGGQVTLFNRDRIFLDGDFQNQSGAERDYGIGYSQVWTTSGRHSSAAGQVFYRDANGVNDRVIARLDLSHEFAGEWLGATWSAKERLQYSDYTSGDSVNDFLSATTFGPTWSLGGGRELGLAAIYSYDFSSDGDVQAFEIGPSFSQKFD
jgi:hypothetical protein